jgi:hypothetical protein
MNLIIKEVAYFLLIYWIWLNFGKIGMHYIVAVEKLTNFAITIINVLNSYWSDFKNFNFNFEHDSNLNLNFDFASATTSFFGSLFPVDLLQNNYSF